MSKKKRFGISQALTRGLSETINVVEHHTGTFRNVVLPLSRIELDPDNPRKLNINLQDVRTGLKSNDPLYQTKQFELEKLKELAQTIQSSGVINPIVVYKAGEHYRVVAGERRCLASILAQKEEIDARIFNEKPKEFELKLIQWIENTAREDLTLEERLGNITDLIREYQIRYDQKEMNATLLKDLTGLSLPQASYYLLVLHAPKDVRNEIVEGNIRSLDKAALLANIASPELRQQAIAACVGGASLKGLRALIKHHLSSPKDRKSNLHPISVRNRVGNKIPLGFTAYGDVVRILVTSIVTQPKYDKYVSFFADTNWHDLSESTRAFRKLIEILEMDMAL